jgi:hypothetical protein
MDGGKFSIPLSVFHQSSSKFTVNLYLGFVALVPEHHLLHAVVVQTLYKQELDEVNSSASSLH